MVVFSWIAESLDIKKTYVGNRVPNFKIITSRNVEGKSRFPEICFPEKVETWENNEL